MSTWRTRYPMAFEEGIDYTLENGKVVMTEKFHRDRGYCCGSHCKNCPWRSKQQKMKELMQNR